MIAVLFLHAMPGICDALANAPNCLNNQTFHLKHVPSGKYIAYRTDGFKFDGIWMDRRESSQWQSSVFCLSPVDPAAENEEVYIIAVDANLCFNGATVKAGLGLERPFQTLLNTLRAHQDDTNYRAIFQFEYVDEYIDEELGVVAQYIIHLRYRRGALKASYSYLKVERRRSPEEVVGEPFAMEYVQ